VVRGVGAHLDRDCVGCGVARVRVAVGAIRSRTQRLFAARAVEVARSAGREDRGRRLRLRVAHGQSSIWHLDLAFDGDIFPNPLFP